MAQLVLNYVIAFFFLMLWLLFAQMHSHLVCFSRDHGGLYFTQMYASREIYVDSYFWQGN